MIRALTRTQKKRIAGNGSHTSASQSASQSAMVNTAAIAVPVSIVGGLFLAWHGLTWWEVDNKCEKPKFTLLKTVSTGSRLWYGPAKTVEIRRYAPYIIASFTADADSTMRESLGKGFMSVAGYIFGKNQAKASEASSTKVAMTSPVVSEKVAMTSPVVSEKVAMTSPVVSEKVAMTSPVVSEKVAMTAPVVSEDSGVDAYTVSFIMPSEYTMATLPTPTDPRVTLKEVPSRTLAALRWRGPSVKEEVMMRYAAELRSALEKEGIKMTTGSAADAPPILFQYHPPFAPPWMRINEVLFEVTYE